MISSTKKMGLIALCAAFISVSCEKDGNIEETTPATPLKTQQKQMSKSVETPALEIASLEIPLDLPKMSENLGEAVASNAIEPSEDCEPAEEFSAVQNKYITPLINDLYAIFANPSLVYNRYLTLSLYAAYFDNSEQYFGANGTYTNFVRKRIRGLEKFWDMPNEITVHGEHTATLNNRERLADAYELAFILESREQAYALADQILFFNSLSPYLPESPFFAIDGFSTIGNLIVIGDGIVRLVSETGIEEKIVWTGILSHEWAHQIQFNHYDVWYPKDAVYTRYTELEADFFAAYYMTHKRGATYNWKRVEEFFDLYFQIGDCSFTSLGHHGTPLQRKAAARLGYELANDAQKQGHILSIEALHEYFVTNFDSLVD